MPTRATLPSRSQLLLPLLETLEELGGSAPAQKAIDVLSDRLNIPDEIRQEQVQKHWTRWGSRTRYPWRQHIHWVRQEGKTKGLIGKSAGGVWTLIGETLPTPQNQTG